MSAVSIGVAKDGQLRVGVRALSWVSWACVAKDLMRFLNFTDLHRVSWGPQVIYEPFRDELFTAQVERGAFLNGHMAAHGWRHQ